MDWMKKSGVVFVLVCSFWMAGAEACSNVLLNSKEFILSGRTMDFDIDLLSEVVVVPVGQFVTSKGGAAGTAISQKSKYGFVGVNAFHISQYVEGLNEKGLSVAKLWLPETKYQEPKDYPGRESVTIDQVGGWILGNFASVAEVNQALDNTIVIAKHLDALKMTPPVHLAIHDQYGASIVVEFLEGKARIYDNSDVKVLTNDPDYAWHLENLKQYEQVTNKLDSDEAPVKNDKRFVLAYLLNKYVNQAASLQAAIADITAIMSRVSVVRGEAIAGESTYANLGAYNYTLWTVIRDHKNKVFYFNDADNLSLRSLDLKKLDLRENAPAVRIELAGGQYHQPVEKLLR